MKSVRQAAVIVDSNVAALHAATATESIQSAGMAATAIIFPAGEEHKNLSTYSRLMDSLLALRPAVDRDAVVVALGGGVCGDLAGFVAATALRGLRWVQCPTTLLADVDASVGGKTAVDHPVGKNLIGAFHQPSAVLIDVLALRTLPARQISNGLAECVKHALIADAAGLDFLETHAGQLLEAQPDLTARLIAHDVAIKAKVVSADEREAGIRAHLNFGHTLGHAIEASVGLGRILHGEAVSLGMVAACRLAAQRGLIGADLAARVESLLLRLGLPTHQEGLDVGAVESIMQHDKKARAGRLRLVLPVGLGRVDVFDDIPPQQVRQAVASLGQ
jgi:3-dehydroquinate synthase